MLNQDNNFAGSGSAFATSTKTVDAGLRAQMIRIFNMVGLGLAISGITSYAVFAIPALAAIFMNPMVSMVTTIGLLLFLWFGMNPNKMMQQSAASLQTKYVIFTAILGTTLAYYYVMYTGRSVAQVFFITAAMFGATSLIGYTTKRDLSGFGSFLIMGLIGILLASVVNIFLKSTGLSWMISIVGVLVFTGLIAFETQNAKRMYSEANGDETNRKLAIYSAMNLYLDFINLFQFLLRLMGNRN